MARTGKNEIFFSFFMFTANLLTKKEHYESILINHLQELIKLGYEGFDVHIDPTSGGSTLGDQVESYRRLKTAFDRAGLAGTKFTTNVGTTRTFDPTAPYEQQRADAQTYLRSRIDITRVLAGDEPTIMAGPFLYPYGVFPLTDDGNAIWSDALLAWLEPRYLAARADFEQLGAYAAEKGVTLAIEPVKNWETPGPNQVSDVLNFLAGVETRQVGVVVDTAQVVMESQGPGIFATNIASAHQAQRLHSVHISAPDRGAVHDSWIPWDTLVPAIRPVYTGPLLVEVFNAIPPFDSSMRMSRRRFWRPGEDQPTSAPSAYAIAGAALTALQHKWCSFE